MAREGTVAQQILDHELTLPGDQAGQGDQATDGRTLRVSIRRTPPAPELQTFDVPFTPGMSVFNVLERIRDTLDPSLAIPISCRIGKCDICFVQVNGRVRWSCTAAPIEGMVIEPAPRYFVMKDLVVDYGRRIKGSAGPSDDDEEAS
jgi:succinate dehydrogenase iron-sulfur subunit